MMEENEKKVRGSADVTYLGKAIDQMVWEFMEEKKIPGLTLAIVQAPYIPRVVGYGMSDLGQRRLASAITVWPVGPVSQAFAAVAVMQLYEQKKIALQDPVSSYVSDLPAEWETVTVEDLLAHASGIPDYRKAQGYDSSRPYRPEELTAMAAGLPMEFMAGQAVKQSATNFLLLAQMVETVSGMSYHDFVTKYQIEAVGLNHTCFSEDLGKLNEEDVSLTGNLHQQFKSNPYFVNPSERATGYDGDLNPVLSVPSSALKGFADIWASAEDISFWDICLAGSILIHEPENRKWLYGGIRLKDGTEVPAHAGWQFYNHVGLMDIKGTIPGFSSFLSRFTDPSELVCVTLLGNREGVDFSNLGRKIAAAFGDALATGFNDRDLVLYECGYSVENTVSRLEDELKRRGIPVFAKFDHKRNAETAGMDMKPASVVVFGSPAVGTHLMLENPSICLELPLKMAVWEDQAGSVWLGYKKLGLLERSYGMDGNPILQKMKELMESIAVRVGNVY